MEPSRPNIRFSFINVEKVVKPPQNPVTNINLVVGEMFPPRERPESNPIRKHPAILTAIVPHGKLTAIHD